MSLKSLPFKPRLIPFVHCKTPLQMLSSCPALGWDRMGVDWWYIQNCMQYFSEPFSVMHLKNSMQNTLTQYHVKSSPDMEHASVPRRSLSTSPGSRGRRAAPSRTCPHTETPLPVLLLLLLHMAPGQRGRKGTRIRLPLERVSQ